MNITVKRAAEAIENLSAYYSVIFRKPDGNTTTRTMSAGGLETWLTIAPEKIISYKQI